MRVDDIREDFELLDDWEDRYRYVIELGRKLPPFPDDARIDANKVRGCASQVWLKSAAEFDGSKRVMRFAGDSDAHIVRGLVAVLLAIYDGHTPDEVLAVDAQKIFGDLGLSQHLTQQRSNGLASMVARIKADAAAVAST
ncbi:MAG: SufE family protein [Hyphomicrobiaceae bacterium]